MLNLVTAGEIEADRAKKRAEKLRRQYEIQVWEDLSDNPNITRLVGDLGLSELAMKCIPDDIKMIGDLASRYSAEELMSFSEDTMHVREIQDELRALGLVLKPAPENG